MKVGSAPQLLHTIAEKNIFSKNEPASLSETVDDVKANLESSKSSGSRQMSTLLRLREMLLNGDFKPGQRMAEIPLAAHLQVSRTPLRIALTSLEHEGLLEHHPTRGFLVRSFRLTDIFDAIEMRGLLEGMAGRHAADRVRTPDARTMQLLDQLSALVLRMDRVIARMHRIPQEAIAEYGPLNVEFHALILELAGSPTLTAELERLIALPFAGPSSALLNAQSQIQAAREVFRMAQYQHGCILEAIRSGDLVRAESLFREHAQAARKNLQLVLDHRDVHHLVPELRLIREASAVILDRIDLEGGTVCGLRPRS